MSKPLEKIAAGVVLVAAFWSGAGAFAMFARTVGVNMILAGASQALMKSPKGPNAAEREGIEINVTGEDQPLYRIYGEVKAGGHLSMLGCSSGVGSTRNELLHYAVTHSVANSCGIESITDVWVGERHIDTTAIDGSGDVGGASVFDGTINVQRYLGTSSETTDAALNAALSYVDGNARGDYMAKTVWTFERVEDDEQFNKLFKGGAPQVQALVRGQKVYDPRLDSTNGGTGTHRLNDPSTWEWSQNNILCAVDYVLAEGLLGGIEVDESIIDWTSVAAAANICDESITVPDGAGGSASQARYFLDIALDTGEDTKANLDKMLAGCMGAVVYTGDSLKFHAGAYETPATEVNNDWLAGGASVRRLTPIGGKYNAVRSTLRDPGAEYQIVQSEPFTSATYETQDGSRRLWKEVQWAGVQNRYSAQYLNLILGRMSRNQKIVVAELNWRGIDIEAWEIVTLDFPDIDVSGSYRVTAWDWTEQGPKVTFEEIADDTYDVELADFTEINPVSRPNEIRQGPRTPSGLSATATVDGIALAWTNPGQSEFSTIEVWRSTSSGGTYSRIRQVTSDGYTDPVTDGSQYYYKIRSRSVLGTDQYSAYTSVVNATAKLVLDYVGGRGVNVMHPRYSVFSELSVPPTSNTNCTVAQRTNASNLAYGTASLEITYTGTGLSGSDGNCRLRTSGSDNNILLRNKKYIVSLWGKTSTATGTVKPVFRLADAGGVVADNYIGTLTGTLTRYSFTLDLTAESALSSYGVNILALGADGIDTNDSFVIDAIMIEEQWGNETEPSDFTPPPGAAGYTAIAADRGQVADQRSMTALVGGNRTPAVMSTDTSLSAEDVGATCTVSIAAHTRQYAEGLISVNAGSVTGLANSLLVHIFYDDRYYAGGSVTYSATTNAQSVSNNKERFYVGSITTPANGAGGTTGGTRPDDCLALDMILEGGIAVRDIALGHALEVMDDDCNFIGKRELQWKGETKVRPCVEIVTKSASVVCTNLTPVICDRPGGALPAIAVKGQRVMTKINGVNQWEEVIDVRDAGNQEIVRMSFGGCSFPGGREAAALVYTHNAEQKP